MMMDHKQGTYKDNEDQLFYQVLGLTIILAIQIVLNGIYLRSSGLYGHIAQIMYPDR